VVASTINDKDADDVARVVKSGVWQRDFGRDSSVSSAPSAVRAHRYSKSHLWSVALGAHQYDVRQPSLSSCRRCSAAFTARLLATLTSSELLTCWCAVLSTSSLVFIQWSVIVHFRSQALTCWTVFPINSVHYSLNRRHLKTNSFHCPIQTSAASRLIIYIRSYWH